MKITVKMAMMENGEDGGDDDNGEGGNDGMGVMSMKW